MREKRARYHRAKSEQGIKFVYFDVGGVFLNFMGSVDTLANVLGAPRQEVFDFWATLDEALNRKTITTDEFWGRIKSHFHHSGPDVNLVDLWVNSFQPIKETHALAKKIARTHKVGILSNAMPRIIPNATKLGHIPRLRFTAIIESHVVGFAKPDPEIYALAQKHAGVEAGEILFIDDREINLPEAQKAGFHTYLFDPENPGASVAELEKILKL